MMERESRKGRMKNKKGFTILEGVIVITIIVTVAVIAIPQFRKMAINGNLKAATKDIISDFSSLRARAISESQNFSVVFDIDNNNYTVPGLPDAKTPAYFGDDIRIINMNFGQIITFQTRGTTAPPMDKTLTLTNGLGSMASITIGTTGRMYVQYALK